LRRLAGPLDSLASLSYSGQACCRPPEHLSRQPEKI